MSVTLDIDYSNGVAKRFSQVPIGANKSVTQSLEAAATLPPGLTYEFDSRFVDRGGREVGAVTTIDGVGGNGRVWGVWVNGRAVSDLRRVTESSFTPFGGVKIEDGDFVSFKLMDEQ